ncbi:hypothetical protein [Chryseobacterium sp. BIGb0232]|uniref:hypothetical protein n=1 Tax=Chryseobacterium sp. BIGb0232 TaxID=2940598 RepID=UPI000F46FD29|nr:hypothetical protein [Chryseobacterium sp. BIGb0232]MCS4305234.1 hypothetical protein [Chryseobacterium sp. BIGb0232]ROS07618.1 hypothetical protein EDF65_4720 [Chryseobacterium nakagawai]
MKFFLTFLLVLFSVCINAQDLEKLSKEVTEEGIALYRSEMASWYGTDVVKENYKNMENIGGYFSYLDDVPKCIFFSKQNKVVATISFPTNYNPANAKVDLSERDFTHVEMDYFTIRQKALTRISNDTIFNRYDNTNFNLVPIIKKNSKKVYVLTGASVNNVVIFGNDYLLTFNNKNEVENVEKLHKGIIVHNIGDSGKGADASGVHSHVLDNWQQITPTDICTLMLYQELTGWETYTTISKKYASIWNNKSNRAFIMKTENFKKITNYQLEKNKKAENKNTQDSNK